MSAFTFKDQAFLASAKSSGVTPDSFPGLYRWYKADSYDGVGVDGDTIGGGTAVLGPWIDQTGSGDNANHPTSGGTYETNVVGSRAVIRQINHFLNFAPGPLTDFTIVVANRRTDLAASYMFLNLALNYGMRRAIGGVDSFDFGNDMAGISADPLSDSADFMVLSCKRSGNAVTFRQNKTARGGGVVPGNWTVSQIGNSTLGGNIDLGEILIWTTVLSDADLDLLYDEYLKPRWTTLP